MMCSNLFVGAQQEQSQQIPKSLEKVFSEGDKDKQSQKNFQLCCLKLVFELSELFGQDEEANKQEDQDDPKSLTKFTEHYEVGHK